jgi:hypothetical protein
MPRIPQAYVDSVIYLYPSAVAAERGESVGGCGILVGVEYKGSPEAHHVYAVTNVHVAKETRVVRYNTGGGTRTVDLTASRWLSHLDGSDVAVCRASIDAPVTIMPTEIFLTRERVEEIPLRHGDELFMASRYISHPGENDNEPIVRFGTLAKSRPVKIDNRESFLAEMRSLPGHSGSPAFVYFTGLQLRLGADAVDALPKSAIYLLGLDWGHPPEKRRVLHRDGRPVPEGFYVNDNSGIACIVPAWKIAEILESDDLVREREEAEAATLSLGRRANHARPSPP